MQVSLIGARPKLGTGRLDAMRETLARMVGIGAADVSIVASTGNLYGSEGAGRVISATCLVVAHRR
jgi:2C-methyl-D-erythritol 2,4-cyclodiphosphate synthase